MIDKITVEKIHAAANIVDIVGDFVTLKKKGVNYQACCPFHNEKTPSFVVSPSKGYYKCFGCGAGGNAIGFVMQHESLSYVEALRYIARKYGITIEEKEQTPEQIENQNRRDSMLTINSYAYDYFKDMLHSSQEGRNVALSYFRERGFSDVTIEKFGLGYCHSSGDSFSTKAISDGFNEEYLVATGLTIKRERGGYYDRFSGRVIFPITSLSGRVIGFGGRIMRNDKKSAKYLNSPESEVYHKSDTLYGIWHAKREISRNNKAILVEGYTDVISMHQAGIENVVASSGTSLTKNQVQLIGRFTKNVTVIYDGDSAGIKASLRGIDIILAEGLNVRVVLLPEGDDPDSFAKSHTAEELNDFIFENEVDFITFKTNLLLESVKNDPLGRAEVVDEVINSISVIGNTIIRNQYVDECAKLLDYDSNIIRSEVAKRNAAINGGAEAVSVEVNKVRKEQFLSHTQSDLQNRSQVGERELYEHEKELVTYLLKYGSKNFYFIDEESGDTIETNVAELIFDELEIDSIELETPLFKEIFNIYKERYENRESLEVVEIEPSSFMNTQSQDVTNFIVQILTEDDKYKQSRIWSTIDGYIEESSNSLDKIIPKAIALYKQQMLNHIRNLLLKESQNDPSNLEILKKIMAVNSSYTALCKKYSRTI